MLAPLTRISNRRAQAALHRTAGRRERDRPSHPAPCSKRKLDPALPFATLQVMPIEWKAASEYESHREEAERRIAERDPDDWPTIALPLKLQLPIGTQDKDHTDARIELSTTGGLLDALREAGHGE